MRRTLTLAAIALVAAGSYGQRIASVQVSGGRATPDTTVASGQLYHIDFAQASCPVGFRAQLGSGPGMVIVDSGTQRAASQQVQLSVDNPGSRGIVSLRVIVHGLSPQPRVTPAVATDGGRSPFGDVDRPATLKLAVGPGAGRETRLGVNGISSIRSIELTEVVYADGTMWHASGDRSCSVEPNRVLLVASH